MKKIITLLSILFIGQALHAESAFQLSITPDIALVERGDRVSGLALNLWGENRVNGLDIGFVNGLDRRSSGLSISFFGTYAKDYTGIILGGFYANSSGRFKGWQNAAININGRQLTGLQTGWINVGKSVKGIQWGLLNYTEELEGVQIGFLNIVTENEWFTDLPGELAPGFPFINWSF